jgi:C-terminal processing protease CtpA/Prc
MKRWLALLVAVLALPAHAVDPINGDGVLACARLSAAVRFFHPGDAVQRVDWDRFLVVATERAMKVTDADGIGPELEKLFSPWVAGLRLSRSANPGVVPPMQPAEAVQWARIGYGKGLRTTEGIYQSFRTLRDTPVELEPEMAQALAERPAVATIDLGAGWWAFVPLKLKPEDAVETPAQREALAAMAATYRTAPVDVADRAASIATGMALWGYARHFYPYWQHLGGDWDAQFKRWAVAQADRQTRAELADSLRRLASGMQDGHAGVFDQRLRQTTAFLPFAMRRIGEQWVVTASTTPQLKPGDVITAIDSRDAREFMNERIARVSGSPQWREWRAGMDFLRGTKDATLRLGIDRAGERIPVEVYWSAPAMAAPARPDAIAKVAEGVWYVDISRFDAKSFDAALASLRAAHAVIFDLRGYPRSDANTLASHWITHAETYKWMYVPLVTDPTRPPEHYRGFGWDVTPRDELIGVRKYLLTDARAISYSESLTGYFASQKAGTIVGEPTAGANGNVLMVQLPNAYGVTMTGMRVVRHDGSVMQARGFQPDVRVVPTIEGLRAGRDEVLDRAVELATAVKRD